MEKLTKRFNRHCIQRIETAFRASVSCERFSSSLSVNPVLDPDIHREVFQILVDHRRPNIPARNSADILEWAWTSFTKST